MAKPFLDDRLSKVIGQIDAAIIDQSVFIRGERHSMADVLLRSLTHLSYHVGQITLITRMVDQREWRWLTIPPGQSAQHSLQTRGTAESRSLFGKGTTS